MALPFFWGSSWEEQFCASCRQQSDDNIQGILTGSLSCNVSNSYLESRSFQIFSTLCHQRHPNPPTTGTPTQHRPHTAISVKAHPCLLPLSAAPAASPHTASTDLITKPTPNVFSDGGLPALPAGSFRLNKKRWSMFPAKPKASQTQLAAQP